ncbi:MAG: zinc ribbon domain-containing protein [Acidobacteriota bacterium]
MPIFEYRCQDCAAEFEKIVFSQENSIECPSCGGQRIEKLLSSFAAHSKGSGQAAAEPGPCPCGAAERGMCQMMSNR